MSDTARGPYPRLSPAAVERAKNLLDISDIDSIGPALGFASRQTFWRARVGLYDIRYSHVQRIARLLDMPIGEVLEGGCNA